jgi:serine protease AprX
MVQAVEAASRAGIIVVVSAGNVGVNPQTNQVGYGGILSPANAPSAFTVAAAKTQGTVDPDDDLIANYSSRGPTWYDGFAKPDFAAPGQNIVAPAAPDSYLATSYPSLLVNDSYGVKSYMTLSGTSMAAGVESGLVAVVLEASRTSPANPAGAPLSGNAIKAFTEYTALTMHDAGGAAYDRLSQGAGRVNGQGVLSLARSVDPSVPAGSPWIVTSTLPYSVYDGVVFPGAQNIVWGENLTWGENLVWGENILWGERGPVAGLGMRK